MRAHPRGDRRLLARVHRDFAQQDSYGFPQSHFLLHRCNIHLMIPETIRYIHDCEPGAREVMRVTACSQV